MNDGLLLGLATIAAAMIAVGVPATLTAIGTRKLAVEALAHTKTAADAAAEAKEMATVAADTIGVRNGNGDAMTMLARGLAENAEILEQNERILAWQTDHADVDNRLVELAKYAHDGIHDLRNAITPLKGQIDMLWRKAGFPSLTEDP